ncbi:MAG: HD domain-containing protein [archaeon]
MEVTDKIYGKYKIKEKIIIDLINTSAIQRLKGIRQQGLPKEWHYGVEYTRYDHSVGVMILLDKLGTPLKERIAGLLHDISHMAFSHVYDYYINNKTESHGDNIFYEWLNKDKEIKSILNKYGYELEDIINFNNFKLLERNSPDLCADRIDYTLRENVALEKDNKLAKKLFNDLKVINNEIVFKNKESAEAFYNIYKFYAENYWGGVKHTMKYNIFVKILKQAIKLELIIDDDFYKTDDYILEKIKKSKDKEIIKNIRKLETNSFKIPDKYTGFTGKKRSVNPKYIYKNKLLYLLDNPPQKS